MINIIPELQHCYCEHVIMLMLAFSSKHCCDSSLTKLLAWLSTKVYNSGAIWHRGIIYSCLLDTWATLKEKSVHHFSWDFNENKSIEYQLLYA